ncbi:MAG: YceI family protein [Pyrinomonadaceae bacterium]|nr:YceI family protein [Phycisphaerales bacterium]
MKIRNYVLAGSLGFVLAVGLAAGPRATTTDAPVLSAVLADGEYNVDAVHSALIFKISHGVGTFFGRFNDITGKFALDAAKPESGTLEFTIKTDSVDTNNDGREKHLKGGDFFNTKQFPESTFKSTSSTKSGDGYEVKGDLTLCGVTKPITVKITNFKTGTDERSKKATAGFEAQFTIKRSDFGITKFGGMLGEDVTIMVGVEGNR